MSQLLLRFFLTKNFCNNNLDTNCSSNNSVKNFKKDKSNCCKFCTSSIFFFATEFDAKISASEGILLTEIFATILLQIFGTKFRCWLLRTTITFHKNKQKFFKVMSTKFDARKSFGWNLKSFNFAYNWFRYFFKILTSFRCKNWSTYRYQFLCKTRHQKSAPKSMNFWCNFLVPNLARACSKRWQIFN